MDSRYDFIGIFNGIFNDFPIIPMSLVIFPGSLPRPFFAAGIAVPALYWWMPASTSWALPLTRRHRMGQLLPITIGI